MKTLLAAMLVLYAGMSWGITPQAPANTIQGCGNAPCAPGPLTALPSGFALPPIAQFTVYCNSTTNPAAPTACSYVTVYCTGIGAVDTPALTAAAGTGFDVVVDGMCADTAQITLAGTQAFGGLSRSNDGLLVGANFNSSAVAVISITGTQTNTARIHDLGIIFAVPPGLTTTTTSAQASGTTIITSAQIPVNYYIDDSTTPGAVPNLTYVTGVAGSGPYTETLSATVTGVLSGDSINYNPARSSFTTLAAGCTTGNNGSGCQYPPAIQGVATSRIQIDNLYVAGAWAGIDLTGGGVVNAPFYIHSVWMGALTYGLRADGAQDASKIVDWHEWEFGLGGNDGDNAWHDGTTIALQLGREDTLQITDLSIFDSRLLITADASNSETPWSFDGVALDGNGANLEVSGGALNHFSQLYRTGTTENAQCPINIAGGTTLIDGLDIYPSGSNNYVCVSAGTLKINGGYVSASNSTINVFNQSGGFLQLEGLYFTLPGTLTNPAITQSAGAFVYRNNSCHTGSSGTLLSITADSASNTVFVDPSCATYTITLPVGNTAGLYTVPTTQEVIGTNPVLYWWKTNAGTNAKGWYFSAGGTAFSGNTVADNGTSFGNGWMSITRSGTTITDESFGNATDNPTVHFNTSGNVSFGGSESVPLIFASGAAFTAAASGCTIGTVVGEGFAGKIPITSTAACTITITFAKNATNTWACSASDITAGVVIPQKGAGAVNTCIISGSVTSGDVIYLAGFGF